MGVDVSKSKCVYCGGCVAACPAAALTLFETRVECDEAKCINCGTCVRACPMRAITLKNKE
ncbi:MAG: 4Fe-4S binding protein [Candidatus Norongarragalinales archaeon]